MDLVFLALLVLCIVGHLWMMKGHGDKKEGGGGHEHH